MHFKGNLNGHLQVVQTLSRSCRKWHLTPIFCGLVWNMSIGLHPEKNGRTASWQHKCGVVNMLDWAWRNYITVSIQRQINTESINFTWTSIGRQPLSLFHAHIPLQLSILSYTEVYWLLVLSYISSLQSRNMAEDRELHSTYVSKLLNDWSE